MTRYVFKMPDLGEGTVEAEVVAWHIKVGDVVKEDQVMAEVMTDKAAVEVPAPVSGRVVTINGQPGDMVRVGSELVVFETETADDDAVAPAPAPTVAATTAAQPVEVQRSPVVPATSPTQAPNGSTSSSRERTAIFVLDPASRATETISTIPLAISGTSCSKSFLTRLG